MSRKNSKKNQTKKPTRSKIVKRLLKDKKPTRSKIVKRLLKSASIAAVTYGAIHTATWLYMKHTLKNCINRHMKVGNMSKDHRTRLGIWLFGNHYKTDDKLNMFKQWSSRKDYFKWYSNNFKKMNSKTDPKLSLFYVCRHKDLNSWINIFFTKKSVTDTCKKFITSIYKANPQTARDFFGISPIDNEVDNEESLETFFSKIAHFDLEVSCKKIMEEYKKQNYCDQNAYTILELSPDDNNDKFTEQLGKNFRRLSRKYHPDKGATTTDDKMKQLTNAREILRKDRKWYDIFLNEMCKDSTAFTWSDLDHRDVVKLLLENGQSQ